MNLTRLETVKISLGFRALLMFTILVIASNSSIAQTNTTQKPTLKPIPQKAIFPDDYSELDDDKQTYMTVDESVNKSIDLARTKYSDALRFIEKGDTSKAAKYFEDALKELNALLSYPGIDQNDEFYDLTQSIIDDYETYVQNIDDLDEDTPIFIIRDKFYKDMELATKSTIKTIPKETKVAESKPEITEFPEDSTIIPLPKNEFVVKNIQYLSQTKARRFFTKWLERSTKYIPMMKRIAAEEGMPEEIVYLSMIESALDPNNVSRASAVGLWQFMRPTGEDYNLNKDKSLWLDERRDPEKSTRAAMRYLKDLYNMFGDWHLAIASYNCGQGRVQKALKKANLKNPNYWDLRAFLPLETKYYVAHYIATSLIAMHPERYGFNLDSITFEKEYKYDNYTLKEPVSLEALANCLDANPALIKSLNPELVRSCTPLDKDSYTLKIPQGSLNRFAANFKSLSDDKKRPWVTHTVRKHETIENLANRYKVQAEEIVSINNISSSKSRLTKGSEIRLPITSEEYNQINLLAEKQVQEYPVDGSEDVFHIVKQGESLYSISRKYGINVAEIKRLNKMSEDKESINVGQQLVIAQKDDYNTISSDDSPKENRKSNTKQSKKVVVNHKVKKGETLASIADDFDVSIASIKSMNKLGKAKVKSGQVLKIETIRNSESSNDDLATKSKKERLENAKSGKLAVHKVKKGENVSTIAARYGITEKELKDLNPKEIKGNSVFAGTRLKVYKTDDDNKGSSKSVSSKVNKLPNYHTIQKGETLAMVAKKFGVSIETIKSKNKSVNETRLQIGQKIRVQ